MKNHWFYIKLGQTVYFTSSLIDLQAIYQKFQILDPRGGESIFDFGYYFGPAKESWSVYMEGKFGIFGIYTERALIWVVNHIFTISGSEDIFFFKGHNRHKNCQKSNDFERTVLTSAKFVLKQNNYSEFYIRGISEVRK